MVGIHAKSHHYAIAHYQSIAMGIRQNLGVTREIRVAGNKVAVDEKYFLYLN